MKDKQLKPKISVFYDKREKQGHDLMMKFFEGDKKKYEILKKSAEEFKKSSNPDAESLANLMYGYYFRYKGINTKANKEAIGYLSESIKFLERIRDDKRELINSKIAYFNRLLHVSKKHEKITIFFELSKLFKEQGSEKESNSFLCLHLMYLLPFVINNINEEETEKLYKLIIGTAKKTGNQDMIHKVSSMYYITKAKKAFSPSESLQELQKALVEIDKTNDKYHKNEIEIDIEFEKAMLIPSKTRRNKELKKISKKYRDQGNKELEDRILEMIYPISVESKQIIENYRIIHKQFNSLSSCFSGLVQDRKCSENTNYHNSYLVKRIDDMNVIIERLSKSNKKLTELHIREHAIFSFEKEKEKYKSNKFQAMRRKGSGLNNRMRLDLETLYIVGNLVLDQWAFVTAHLVGMKIQDKFGYGKFYHELRQNKSNNRLAIIWENHKDDIIWLYYNIREFRNKFIEHLERPLQQGTTRSVFGDSFNLHVPTPPMFVNKGIRNKKLKSISHLAPEWLKNAPEEYWEKANKHRMLEVTMNNIEKVDKHHDREKVWALWKEFGGSTLTYQKIAGRLASFLKKSVATLESIAEEK
jgi:hypothetical protein